MVDRAEWGVFSSAHNGVAAISDPIPANDSSLEVVGLFLTLVKKAIKTGVKKRHLVAKKKNITATEPLAKSPRFAQKNVKKVRSNTSKSSKNLNNPVKRKGVKNKKK